MPLDILLPGWLCSYYLSHNQSVIRLSGQYIGQEQDQDTCWRFMNLWITFVKSQSLLSLHLSQCTIPTVHTIRPFFACVLSLQILFEQCLMCFFVGLQSIQKISVVTFHFTSCLKERSHCIDIGNNIFIWTIHASCLKERSHCSHIGINKFIWIVHARYVRRRSEVGERKRRTVQYCTVLYRTNLKTCYYFLYSTVHCVDYFWSLRNRSRLSKVSF